VLLSYEWLKEFVDIKASPDEMSDKLTMVGLEVEGSVNIGNDTVFEVNVTPNRPDCLSIYGIAREVAAVFRLPLKIPDVEISTDIGRSDVRVEILDPDLCHRYAGRSVKGVKVGETPDWIKDRLEKCGIRALNNNVVDVTNYVLLEIGHPLHAFDEDKLKDSTIRIAKSGKSKSVVTLDGVERQLDENTLLIWDAINPVAIAGIMGGEDSGVTFSTKNVFLESAYFTPLSIRKSSKLLNLKTESSYRFERGTDIVFLESALNRAAKLICLTGGGEISDIVDEYPVKYVPEKIEVSYDKVNSFLGTEISKQEMMDVLETIGIETEDMGKSIHVKPPAFRRDIAGFVDVVEEVARCYNYANIPVKVPKTVMPEGILNTRERSMRRIKEAFKKAGFSEVINYSFMNSSDLDLLGIPPNDKRRGYISLRNPLRQEDSLMRTTLIPSLLNNFLYNYSRAVKNINFFELSRVFIDSGEQLPYEYLMLGGIYYRDPSPYIWKDDIPAFFIVKGAVESFFSEMRCEECLMRPTEEIFLHPGKSADIYCDNQKIGFMGELGPHVIEKLNLKRQKPEIIVFELYIDLLFALLPEKIAFTQIPKYPAIERDLAIIVDNGLTASQILDALKNFRPDLIEHVELFDFYKGKNVSPDKKSLAFSIIYRSTDRTLTDSEIEPVHRELVEYISEKTGGEVRGQS
jgi:phenylalanyl-tRNA synthetase beta chain